MATAAAEIPTDWQEQVINFLKKTRDTDPTKAVFGLSFPEAWKGELMKYVRNGDVRRMFGVNAVSFSGSKLGTFSPPEKDKEEAKTAKKAG